jgi:HEAT repeat protein
MPKPDIPFETLLADLHHPDFNIRSNAARALGQSRDPRAVEALLPDLNDPDWRVRRNAAQALGALRDRQAVEPLIGALNDRTMTVRSRAVVALGRIKDERAIPPLLEAFTTSKNWQLHQHTFQALRKFGKKLIPAVTAALPGAADDQRDKLVSLLGATGRKEALEPLLQALYDPNMIVRWQAACGLGAIGEARAVKPLLQALATSPEAQTQSMIVQALGRLGDAAVVPTLLTLLHDHELYGPHSNLYRTLTEALQRLSGMPHSFGGLVRHEVPIMMSLLNDEQTQSIQTMLDTVGEQLATFANVLGQAQGGTTPSRHLLNFVEMLSGSQNKAQRERESLIAWLKADSPLLRIAAAVSLPWYLNKKALDPLNQATLDPDADVRKAALWALGALTTTLRYKGE